MQTRKTKMSRLAGWEECQSSEKNAQHYVREVMMTREKVEYAASRLQCMSREENCTGIQECKMCWQRIVGNRRFDGVAVEQTNWVIYTFEFKRTSDREHGYIQRCDERATEQHASLVQIVREMWRAKEGKYTQSCSSLGQNP